jgi:hypothetical protein
MPVTDDFRNPKNIGSSTLNRLSLPKMSELPGKTYAFDQQAQRLHPSPERGPARETLSRTIEVASETSYGSRDFSSGPDLSSSSGP